MYVLTALEYSWFWAAIWVLFYLRFTNYAGIGLLESIMIVTAVVGEVPTGAIADMLGKKKTIALAFFFGIIGNAVMGFADSFVILSVGVMIATIGGTLSSGTNEAMLYDSLLSIKKESTYEKVLANISSIRMLTLAITSVIGGFMYKVNPGLPFIALAVMKLVGMLLSFKLTEPPIDTYTFSWTNYLKQTKEGMHELFKTKAITTQNILVIALTMVVVMNGHVLIDAQLVAEGWSADQLGVIVFIMYLASALIGQSTDFFSKTFGQRNTTILAALLIAATMLLVPMLGMIAGTILIASRNGIIEIFGNSASNTINSTTASKYRATALSSYSMFANIPYVIGAFGIGFLMDRYSVHTVTAVIGIILLFVGLFALFKIKRLGLKEVTG